MKKLFYLVGILYLLVSCTVTKTAYQKDSIKQKQLSSSYPKDKSITEFEPPQYIGGNRELLKFISKMMNYPTAAADKRIQGKVYVQFLVSKLGKVQNVKIKKSSGYTILDKEALRVVKLLDKMIPAKDTAGNPIDCYMELPLTFRLGNEIIRMRKI